jgi:hypothetical protein
LFAHQLPEVLVARHVNSVPLGPLRPIQVHEEPQLNGGVTIGVAGDQAAIQLGQADIAAVYGALEGRHLGSPRLATEVKHCNLVRGHNPGVPGQKVGDIIDDGDSFAMQLQHDLQRRAPCIPPAAVADAESQNLAGLPLIVEV